MAEQVWETSVGGRIHRVVTNGDIVHTVTWSIDGEQVAEKTTLESKVTLKAHEESSAGYVTVRFSSLGAPRRATLVAAEGLGELGVGGTELAPTPGSAAAVHHEKVLAHPTRYTVIATVGGIAKVVVPIILTALAIRLAVTIPWPDLPDLPDIPWPGIPWPDLPAIPWPDIDLPAIPWPDVSLPAWARWILEHAKYVLPVLVAFAFARAEVRRRRRHAEEMQARQRTAATTSEPGPADDEDDEAIDPVDPVGQTTDDPDPSASPQS